ncbi:protein ROLLING AND ERECT LEAF 2-like [Gastrolobium bilobum]|uniref:protein ROLLING AND ERECT LEAF 2-like n=1 Tax=Gastrolobium bilobum TaxID=150636 RepID=UPI002AB00827|nr:protein ROLLING AND ERECT LEAF 2-like [Gastrolobium bilobum]
MGCGGSKVEDLPLVTLCRERKEFLKAASEQRYALAAAHIAYFHSLRDIGDALTKFADQDLFFSGSSSPVLTLPSDEHKPKKKNNTSSSSPSISISHADSLEEGSHLHLSSGSELSSPSSDHIHLHHSPEPKHKPRHRPRPDPDPEPDTPPSSSSPPPPPPFEYHYYHPQDWNQPPGMNTYAYYMKSSAPHGKSMVYEEEERHVAKTGQWTSDSPNGYGYGYGYGNGGFFGSPAGDYSYYSQAGPSSSPAPPPPPPAPPSPPRVSTWDFLNFFDSYDYGYQGKYGIGSIASSPDSKEVREREGIPELEDETEHEVVKEEIRHKEKKKFADEKPQKEKVVKGRDFGEGTSNSKAVPLQQVSSSEGSSKTVRFHGSDGSSLSHEKEIKSSPDTVVSESSPEGNARKKGVSFEVVDEATVTAVDGESSVLSSVTTLSAHGTRDLREVVQEIRDEFETASNCGKEVALLLEVCKPPYRSKVAAFRVIFSRILQMVAPSGLPSHPPSRPPIQYSSRAMKLAKAYCGEPGDDFKANTENLSSTLEKLYAWEKKLYKEVKDEERLRAIYEKQCKRLKTLDYRGAETSKIDATEASIRKLLTKMNICIRTVEAISGKIHKLRDDELQPQLAELINGLIRMWKFMLRCHQKQFQAIMESKTQSLKINTGLQRDEGLKAILELEKELLNWCSQFNNWVKTQKSYVKNLNEWLIRCLHNEPEETADGIVPFSPSRIGAPPVFIICNDWHQAMDRISERMVADAMREFALKLHELWERHDEEQRQRIKAEYLTKDFEKQIRTLRSQMGSSEHEHDKVSGKTALSKLHSDSGVSPLDDLKVDLDSMRKRLHEERVRHKEAIKLVNDAASNSLQAGLIPIFKTLESFTSEVVKAHEQVRLQNAGDS